VGEAAFNGFWSAGDSAWFAGLNPEPTTPATAPEPPPAPLAHAAPGWPRLRLRRPSDQPGGSVPGAALFSAHAANVFGAAVHEAFAQIEWLADPASAAARAPAAMAASGEVRAEIDACLRAPEIARLFAHIRPAAEVWRERAFELLLGDELVSGAFDRVIVERDATGRATAATVVDFKTDRLASPGELDKAAARHRPQLDRYREALAHLLGLPAEKISATVVFTHLRRAVAM
jgi:ATP-dependent helicase/nuclease subunit A